MSTVLSWNTIFHDKTPEAAKIATSIFEKSVCPQICPLKFCLNAVTNTSSHHTYSYTAALPTCPHFCQLKIFLKNFALSVYFLLLTIHCRLRCFARRNCIFTLDRCHDFRHAFSLHLKRRVNINIERSLTARVSQNGTQALRIDARANTVCGKSMP